MGPKAFCYYVAAAINSFRGESEYGHPLRLFCEIIKWRLQNHRAEIVESFPVLREGLQYIINHWGKWDDYDLRSVSYVDDLKKAYMELLDDIAKA